MQLGRSVAGPPRTYELRGCCNRGRENQRVPKWLLWPVLRSGMYEFHPQPTGHTQSYFQIQECLGNIVFPVLKRGKWTVPRDYVSATLT